MSDFHHCGSEEQKEDWLPRLARLVADSEAIHSYEGTREINSLIVGQAITGHSAFVGR